MNKFFSKFLPQDLIAVIVIVGAFILKILGANGTISLILTTVVIFYFGKKVVIDPIQQQIMPEAKAETVEQIIRRVAKDEGVDPDLAFRVAKCESGLNPGAVNHNTNGSVDRGLYQINTKWHPGVGVDIAFEVEPSIRFFCKALKAGHLNWWDASKKCWDI